MMDSWAVDIDRMRAVQALPARHRIFAVTLDQGTSCAYNRRRHRRPSLSSGYLSRGICSSELGKLLT